MLLHSGLSTVVKQGDEAEGQGILDVLGSGRGRAVVGVSLDAMGCLRGLEAAFDAFDHHVADHLAAEAGGDRGPADDLTVVAVEDEGDAHHLAVPAGELEAVRAPALVGPWRCDHSLVFYARSAGRCVAPAASPEPS